MSTALKTTRFREAVEGYDAIDREAGVIRGVRVLGCDSRNGRAYLREAITEAVPLYEGAKVYLDHMRSEQKERGNSERWGKLSGVRQVEDGGLVADLSYLKSHPLTESMLEAIERFSDFGLSQDAEGVVENRDGRPVVTAIEHVYSIDVVQKPATTTNLFESESVMRKKILATLRENQEIQPAALLVERMQEMQAELEEMTGEGLEEMSMEVDEGMYSEDDGTYAVGMAFKAAMMAVLDNGSLSTDQKMEKLRALLAAKQEVTSESSDEDSEEMSEGYNKMKESYEQIVSELNQLREEKALFEAKEKCRSLLESCGREATDIRIEALVAVKPANRKALIESWPKQATEADNSNRPSRSPSRVFESEGEDALPQSFEEFRKKLHC